MNKKNNRKGFTIVELVIVIAVIAILATVLVPTFSGIVERAQTSKLLQQLKNEYTEYVIKAGESGTFTDDIYVYLDGKYYQVNAGVPNTTALANAPTTGTCWCVTCEKVLTLNATAHTCS